MRYTIISIAIAVLSLVVVACEGDYQPTDMPIDQTNWFDTFNAEWAPVSETGTCEQFNGSFAPLTGLSAYPVDTISDGSNVWVVYMQWRMEESGVETDLYLQPYDVREDPTPMFVMGWLVQSNAIYYSGLYDGSYLWVSYYSETERTAWVDQLEVHPDHLKRISHTAWETPIGMVELVDSDYGVLAVSRVGNRTSVKFMNTGHEIVYDAPMTLGAEVMYMNGSLYAAWFDLVSNDIYMTRMDLLTEQVEVTSYYGSLSASPPDAVSNLRIQQVSTDTPDTIGVTWTEFRYVGTGVVETHKATVVARGDRATEMFPTTILDMDVRGWNPVNGDYLVVTSMNDAGRIHMSVIDLPFYQVEMSFHISGAAHLPEVPPAVTLHGITTIVQRNYQGLDLVTIRCK